MSSAGTNGRITLAVATLGVVLALCRDAHATSCSRPTPALAVENAEVIFRGEVVDRGGDVHATRATVKVDRVFKGDVSDSVVVRAGGLHGYSGFEPGRTYLIFARVDGSELFADVCGATMSWPPSGAWTEGTWKSWSVDALGPGHPPKASAPPAASEPSAAAPPSAAASHDAPPAAPSGTPTPAPKGGCAGCAVSDGSSPDGVAIASAVVGAAVAVRRAARQKSRSCRTTRAA